MRTDIVISLINQQIIHWTSDSLLNPVNLIKMLSQDLMRQFML